MSSAISAIDHAYNAACASRLTSLLDRWYIALTTNHLYGWLEGMDTIGIFEAKTKFPGLCDDVVRRGSSIMVKRRGKPLVMITPVPADYMQEREGIFTAWERWKDDDDAADFPEVWKERNDKSSNPLGED